MQLIRIYTYEKICSTTNFLILQYHSPLLPVFSLLLLFLLFAAIGNILGLPWIPCQWIVARGTAGSQCCQESAGECLGSTVMLEGSCLKERERERSAGHNVVGWWISEWVSEWVGEWVGERVSEWVAELVSGSVSTYLTCFPMAACYQHQLLQVYSDTWANLEILFDVLILTVAELHTQTIGQLYHSIEIPCSRHLAMIARQY